MRSLKILKKIRDKLDEYIENREFRSRRASYTQPHPHSWAPDPFEEERKRRRSYDERTRRHTDSDLNGRRISMAANEKRTLKTSNNGLRNRDRVSERNLPGPRKSRDVVAKPGNDGQEGSPRKSDGELVRRRRENQRAMRITDRSRDPNEHIDRLREDFPPIPPFPPQWTAKARRDRSLPLPPSPKLPRVDANQPFQRNRSEKRAEKQPTVDWDAMVRAKNEQIRLVAEAKSQEEENKRRAAEQKWKAAEQRRRAEEEHGTVDWRPLSKTENKKSEATCQCEPVNYGRRKQEVENSQNERQGEREEAEKRSKAEEAEKKARTVRVQRENEERRR
ncbi:hypothetical protein L207DRAFT_619109 [Hyaloscypha variabilis F]|uniref:Uncharacterized protein n=1 Tax=Hyaloscypha variabilis (strain UAMH 11265 / GT02V1 / F) TaxID=1149755 RepID=A0A2J6S0A9_HYAVF|nr:hypothetical protein L207DRAFT_619109 [Hyaloscypha variabilis F]